MPAGRQLDYAEPLTPGVADEAAAIEPPDAIH